MRSRQRRWMSARATERDRAEVFSEIASDGGGALGGVVNGNEVLARVTERIHERLQRELRNEQYERPLAASAAASAAAGGEGGGRAGEYHRENAPTGEAVRSHIEDYMRTLDSKRVRPPARPPAPSNPRPFQPPHTCHSHVAAFQSPCRIRAPVLDMFDLHGHHGTSRQGTDALVSV